MNRYKLYDNYKFSQQKKIKSFLLENKVISRMEIADFFEISKSTVTKVTSILIEDGVAINLGENFNDKGNRIRGRRKILIGINKNYKLLIGIYLNSKDVTIALTNMIGEILQITNFCIKQKSYIEILEQIVLNIERILSDNYIKRENIIGAGLVVDEKFTIDNQIIEILKIKKDLSYGTKVKICNGSLKDSIEFANIYFGITLNNNNLFLAGCAYSLEIFFVLI